MGKRFYKHAVALLFAVAIIAYMFKKLHLFGIKAFRESKMAHESHSDYCIALETKDKQHYLSKLTLSSGEKLPDPLVLSDWSDDIRNLPNITWRDVTEYLIDSPSVFTKESMKAYKSLEAYDYFACGHVQDCFYNGLSEETEFCFIKSEVIIHFYDQVYNSRLPYYVCTIFYGRNFIYFY